MILLYVQHVVLVAPCSVAIQLRDLANAQVDLVPWVAIADVVHQQHWNLNVVQRQEGQGVCGVPHSIHALENGAQELQYVAWEDRSAGECVSTSV